jgi:hypothetical protein
MEAVDFSQANSCTAIGARYHGGVRSGWQVKHECRFQCIWWRKSILLDVRRINIVLPVIVARNR